MEPHSLRKCPNRSRCADKACNLVHTVFVNGAERPAATVDAALNCKYHLNNLCSYGTGCRNRHCGEDGGSQPPTPRQASSAGPDYTGSLCRFKSRCNDRKCLDDHPILDAHGKEVPPVPPKLGRNCMHFMNDTCTRVCGFRHAPPKKGPRTTNGGEVRTPRRPNQKNKAGTPPIQGTPQPKTSAKKRVKVKPIKLEEEEEEEEDDDYDENDEHETFDFPITLLYWNFFRKCEPDTVKDWEATNVLKVKRNGQNCTVCFKLFEDKVNLQGWQTTVCQKSFRASSSTKETVSWCKKLYPDFFFGFEGTQVIALALDSLRMELQRAISDLSKRQYLKLVVECKGDVRRLAEQKQIDWKNRFGFTDPAVEAIPNPDEGGIVLSGFVSSLDSEVELVEKWLQEHAEKSTTINLSQELHAWWSEPGQQLLRETEEVCSVRIQLFKPIPKKKAAAKGSGYGYRIKGLKENVDAAFERLDIDLVTKPFKVRVSQNRMELLLSSAWEDLSVCGIRRPDKVIFIGEVDQVDAALERAEALNIQSVTLPMTAKKLKELQANKNVELEYLMTEYSTELISDYDGLSLQLIGPQNSIDAITALLTGTTSQRQESAKVDMKGFPLCRQACKKGVKKFFDNEMRHYPQVTLKAAAAGKHIYTLQGPASMVSEASKRISAYVKKMEENFQVISFPVAEEEAFLLEEYKTKLNEFANRTGTWVDLGNSSHSEKPHRLGYRQKVFGVTIEALRGDIARQQVDAIVNAANSNLQHSGGVAKAIQRVADIQASSHLDVSVNGPVQEGGIRIGESGNLANQGVKHIIHAVGPTWEKSSDLDLAEIVLESLIIKVLDAAKKLNIRSIAFPLISSGIFNKAGAEIEERICGIIAGAIKKATNVDLGSLKVIRLVESTQGRFKNLIDSLETEFGLSTGSLESELRDTQAPTMEVPKFIFSWQDDDRSMKPYDINDCLSLSKALEKGQQVWSTKIDNPKYRSGQDYSIHFQARVQINDKTQYQRKIDWEPNPEWSAAESSPLVIPLPIPGAIGIGAGSSVTIRFVNHELVNAPECQKIIEKLISDNIHNELWDIPDAVHQEDLDIAAVKYGVSIAFQTAPTVSIRGSRLRIMDAKSSLISLAYNSVQIRRPDHWSDDKDEILCSLDPSSAEYTDVVSKIHATIPSAQIHSIHRVQNMNQYRSFRTEYNKLTSKLGKKPTVKNLFHGTKLDRDSLVSHESGFSKNYSASGMWGQGCYFAANASYSLHYSRNLQNGTNQKEFFLVDVLVGDSILVMPNDSSLKEPPIKSGNDRYDSVEGITGGSNVFITYSDCRQYPTHAIIYTP